MATGSADLTGSVLDEAWGHVPQTRDVVGALGTFTRRRIERMISLIAALGSLVLGLQALAAALGSAAPQSSWHLPLVLLAFVPLALMLVACVTGRAVAMLSGVFAVSYLIVLAVWPVATAGTVADPLRPPWIWYLVSVATVAGVLAFPLLLQVAWTVLVPLLFGVVHLVGGGISRDSWFTVVLDVSFALVIGGVIVVLAWMLRSVAGGVDEAQSHAVDSYTRAAAADAQERERVAVAALMHDSVLAALIAAERATTPRERDLAVAMAREALTRLANTEQGSEEGSDHPRPVESLAVEIERAAADLGVELVVDSEFEAQTPPLPGRVARALVLAATQAVANAIQHADARGLAVTLRSRAEPMAVWIAVSDEGRGFDIDAVPDDRLGIRGSIIARIAAVGGTAQLIAAAHGTTVRLEWPTERR